MFESTNVNLFIHRYVNKQYHVHQQSVYYCWYRHFSAVEDEWRGGDGDGLSGVLHPDFNDDGLSHSSVGSAYPR